ncbi:DNA topoisomerase [Halobaculum sp. MBLA0147]|uniref:DNA topoisomerase I n=1 Tax=Halobaculum sp. MBLA0147 TaxID=3079934 RepID=UPI003525E34B
MELIVTEKDNAARRLAEIRSEGSFDTERRAGTNVYRWGATRCIGLSGHVVGLDFPPEYSDWRDVEPVELIDAPVQKEPTKEGIVAALRSLAAEADRVIVATDYDREGELIGKEAYEIVREAAPEVPVDRVRFSSITAREVNEAFANPDEIDFELAAAGEARQEIDLVWGAALTRFLSLSAGQLGDDFVSVGRVQGPTLKLLVDREREIRAFDPEDYWELFADLQSPAAAETETDAATFEAQYFYEADDGTEAERVWDEATAEAVAARLAAAETAPVTSVRRRSRTDDPPAPFDTTAYISAAGSLGYSAQRAMSLAEELYTAGYVTYPRTDNTVYPEDLDERELIETFTEVEPFADDAASLLEREEITPTEGDEETTDHPPIHPTAEVPNRSDLSEDEWEVYELVVRRFLATCAEPAEWEHLRVVSEVDAVADGVAAGEEGTAQADGGVAAAASEAPLSLKANGKRLVEAGYHDVYPYLSASETLVPDVSEGEELVVTDSRSEAKQTQPPRRYGQSRLIEKMKELGVGTKSTRHNVIEKLYDRGYVESDPPRPTRLAEAVVDAAEEFAEQIVTEEMTAQLEADMEAIARGDVDYEDVAGESREMLDQVFEALTDSRDEVGDHLRESLKADKRLGPCPESDHDLLVRQARGGSYFVGCDGYPDCEFTLPLPSTGRPILLEEECEEHGLAHVKMLAGRKTFVHGCPACKAEAADESEDVVIGVCPDCGDADGGELAIKQLRSGNRLVGCTRYPDCEYSLPLPRRGEVVVTEETCADHALPHLEIHDEDDDEPWALGCPICNYREYQARQAGSELETLDGIGEATAEKLEAAGIDDVGELADADPETLAEEVDGVGVDTIRDWQDQIE